MTAGYHWREVSEKRCSCTSLTSPNPLSLKQWTTCISYCFGRLSSQHCHCFLSSSSDGSSLLKLFQLSVSNSNVAFMTCCAMNPKGSKMEWTADTIPLRVIGLWFVSCNIFSKTSHANLSFSVFHLRPKALSVGSRSSYTLTTALALPDSRIAASTSLSLL